MFDYTVRLPDSHTDLQTRVTAVAACGSIVTAVAIARHGSVGFTQLCLQTFAKGPGLHPVGQVIHLTEPGHVARNAYSQGLHAWGGVTPMALAFWV